VRVGEMASRYVKANNYISHKVFKNPADQEAIVTTRTSFSEAKPVLF